MTLASLPRLALHPLTSPQVSTVAGAPGSAKEWYLSHQKPLPRGLQETWGEFKLVPLSVAQQDAQVKYGGFTRKLEDFARAQKGEHKIPDWIKYGILARGL